MTEIFEFGSRNAECGKTEEAPECGIGNAECGKKKEKTEF
jgi:hypothetical protein